MADTPEATRPPGTDTAGTTPDTPWPAGAEEQQHRVADPTQDPLRYGVGARLTLSVMSEDYATVILDALAQTDSQGLVVRTGDVSTYVGGSEERILQWVTDLAEAVARGGHHASVNLLLSRGCPGELDCQLPGGAGPRSVPIPTPRRTGRYATAEWALYPLADAHPGGRAPDHMRDIYAAIDHAKELCTYVGSDHFVTRLAGDLGDVLATALGGWILVGRTVQHVTTHLTVSLNSPSHTTQVISSPQENAHA